MYTKYTRARKLLVITKVHDRFTISNMCGAPIESTREVVTPQSRIQILEIKIDIMRIMCA